MNAYMNLIEGSKQMERERLERVANFEIEREKAEQQAQAEIEDGPAHEFIFPEGISNKDKLLLMTSAITNLTNTIKGGK